MALTSKSRPFHEATRVLGGGAKKRPFRDYRGDPPAVETGIAVRCHNAILTNRVRALTVLPGETVTFEVVDCDPGSGYLAQPAGGKLMPLGTGRWE
jgi:hypothetical protein